MTAPQDDRVSRGEARGAAARPEPGPAPASRSGTSAAGPPRDPGPQDGRSSRSEAVSHGSAARSASASGGDAAIPGPVFLFDGDCAFCSGCARFLQRRVRTEAQVLPWQWADLAALDVTQSAAEQAVIWAEGPRILAGPDALAVLLRRAQWYWRPLGWLLSLRPVAWLAWPAYRLVARNRHRLPGGTAACSLPQSERDRRAS